MHNTSPSVVHNTSPSARCLPKEAPFVIVVCVTQMAFRHALWLLLPTSILADLVCYRRWYFDRPQPAPRRCPPANPLTYYECCGPLDDCCQRIRWEPIIVCIVVVLLLIVCCCCCILGFVFRRRKTSSEKPSCESGLSKDEADCHRI